MYRYLLLFCLFASVMTPATGQAIADCKIAFNEVDPFDNLRSVGAEPVAVGYMIPSRFELVDGPKLIEEAEIITVYAENDSISGFFFNLVTPEYKLQPIGAGMNVKLLLADTTVIGLYNYPDEGQFDRSINMRVYQHTCALPLDYFYLLAYHKITQIRIEYKRQNRTFKLSDEQGEALRKSIQCVGQEAGLYPIRS